MTEAVPVPLLSILMPTKDRYDTLMRVVAELTKRIRDQRFEIVVCDNSPRPDAEQVAALTNGNPRVSYHHSTDDLSIVENTERAIDASRGEYLCFIGDDDLVSPHIMSIVDWFRGQDAECLIYPPARYWWSSVAFAKQSYSQRPGVFWLPHDRTGELRQRQSADELATVLARGGVSYMDLPRLYHGIVARQAMDRVKARFGRYVPGSSPDMALCVALALSNSHYLSLGYPVTVFGASRNSGGGLTAARKHYGRIEDQKMLPRDILDNWNPRLPRVWSEQIIYPQTIHEIFSKIGKQNTLSYPTLYGSLIAYEPHIIRHLLPVLRDYVAEQPSRLGPLIVKTALKVAGRARTTLRSKSGMGMPFDIDTFADIGAVMEFLEELPPPSIVADPVKA